MGVALDAADQAKAHALLENMILNSINTEYNKYYKNTDFMG